MDLIKELMQIKYKKTFLIWVFVTVVPYSWCTDEYQREIFLGPRNFNPHPYEHHLAKIQDPGPVTFPENEENETPSSKNRYNIVTVDTKRSKHPIDNHPYSKVSQKIKFLLSRKYSNSGENQIDAEVYDALAQQGAKVLGYTSPNSRRYQDTAHLQKKNYAFAYKVLDKGSGDDFSHQQIRSSKTTNGEYRVKLPDGRIQIVSYKADKNGYKADVKYEDDPEFTHQNLIQPAEIQNIHQYVPENVDIQRVPVRQLKPRGRPAILNSYDYAAEEGEQQLVSPIGDPDVVLLEQAGPTQLPVKYVDIGVTPSPSPAAYLLGGGEIRPFRPQENYPNVQIYTTNARDNLQESYHSTTAATPYYGKGVARYTSTPVPPVQAQVNHIGDHGLYNPTAISSYTPPVKQLGNYKNVISRPDASGRVGGSPEHQRLAQENELPEGIYIVGKPGKRK